MSTSLPEAGWLEPESAANEDNKPQYPFNKITQTESGHSFEMDDTPNRERVKLMHRTGTFIEMHPNGDEVHKVYGDGYEITIKDKFIKVKGRCNITIEGDSVTEIMGNKYEVVRGDYNLVVNGNMSFEGRKDMTMGSQCVFKLTSNPLFGGYLDINTGGTMHLKGDLVVEGTLNAGDIFSQGRVDAFKGVSAGPMGFVSLLGGLSIGIPVAIPGNITCLGLINAGISVTAPLGSFLISDAVFMTDNVNTALHNCHFHFGFKGPTSGPIPRMI
jgi:hypothetical protein